MNPAFPGGHAIAFDPDGTRVAVSDGKKTTVRGLPPMGGEVAMGRTPRRTRTVYRPEFRGHRTESGLL